MGYKWPTEVCCATWVSTRCEVYNRVFFKAQLVQVTACICGDNVLELIKLKITCGESGESTENVTGCTLLSGDLIHDKGVSYLLPGLW